MGQENSIAQPYVPAAIAPARRSAERGAQNRVARTSQADRCHFSASVAIDELFEFQTNRVYVLEDFDYRADGDLLISAYAVSSPTTLIRLRFDSTKVTSIWQESYFRETMSWPLDIVRLQSESLAGGRFRFTLTCVDFEWTWESNWPQFV